MSFELTTDESYLPLSALGTDVGDSFVLPQTDVSYKQFAIFVFRLSQ